MTISAVVDNRPLQRYFKIQGVEVQYIGRAKQMSPEWRGIMFNEVGLRALRDNINSLLGEQPMLYEDYIKYLEENTLLKDGEETGRWINMRWKCLCCRSHMDFTETICSNCRKGKRPS